MQILTPIMDVILAAYIAREVIRFVPRYRQLKLAIAQGDMHARSRVYWEALSFEWISFGMAIMALGLDWRKLNPQSLGLDALGLPVHGDLPRGMLTGVLAGVAGGTIAMVVGRLRAKRRGMATAKPAARWQKLLPDFSALMPTTARERMLWSAVAVSAGICEEVVFRGWLLATLHGAGLGGVTLIILGAVAFGLAHAYQGISGMVLTAFAGAFFCVLYVATGSLLVPILLHVVVDLRFAFLPAPRMVAQPVGA